MRSGIGRWRRRSAWLWIIVRLFVVLGVLWVGSRLGRGRNGRDSRAIEEFASAVAPLVLFALVSLLVDSAPPPEAWASLA